MDNSPSGMFMCEWAKAFVEVAVLNLKTQRSLREPAEVAEFRQFSVPVVVAYFSLATTNSGAHNNARLVSLSGKPQIAFRANAAYCMARALAASTEL